MEILFLGIFMFAGFAPKTFGKWIGTVILAARDEIHLKKETENDGTQ